MNYSPDDLAKQSGDRVEIRFEIEMSDYERSKSELVGDLATALKIRTDEIWITGIRAGCVILNLKLPKDSGTELEREFDSATRSPEMETFFKKFNVQEVRKLEEKFAPNISKKISAPLGRSVTWLHISDLHLRQRSQGGSAVFAQDKITSRFIEQLPDLLAMKNLRPDFVFFTGDVAMAGEDGEYREALSFFESLQNVLPSPAKMFFIPGNHDVTWSRIDSASDKRLKKEFVSQDEVNSFLLDKKTASERARAFSRQDGFFEFSRKCMTLGQPTLNGEYFFSTFENHAGLKIAIAGFNSAWLSTRRGKGKAEINQDHQSLLLGEPQVLESTKLLKDAHLKIAMVHHPPCSEWFMPFDVNLQKAHLQTFDFVLRGHEHLPDFIGRIRGPREWQEIAAGALFTRPANHTGFNAVKINLDAGWMTLFQWRYFDQLYRWDVDVEHSESGGEIDTLLPRGLIERMQRKD